MSIKPNYKPSVNLNGTDTRQAFRNAEQDVGNLQAGFYGITVVTQNYALLVTDIIVVGIAGCAAFTLPVLSSCVSNGLYKTYYVKNGTANTITLNTTGNALIDGNASVALGANMGLYVVTDGNNWYTVPGIFPATTVTDVGASDVVGVDTTYAREDHIHRGVHKITESTDAYGNITFAGAVTQSGATFTFTGTGTPATTVTDVEATGVVGTSANFAREDHAHRGVHKITESGDAFGDIVFAGAGVSQSGNTFTFSGGGGSHNLASYTNTTNPYIMGTHGEEALFEAVTGGLQIVTLPSATSIGYPLWVMNTSAGLACHVYAPGTESMNGTPGGFQALTVVQGGIFISDGSNWWCVSSS